MTILNILDQIRDFLNDSVFPGQKLKKQLDNEDGFELVQPVAYSLYLPAKAMNSDQQLAPAAFVLMGGKWADDGTKLTGKVRISFIVYNAGKHLDKPAEAGTKVQLELGTEGWRDLLNLMEHTKATLLKNRYIKGVAVNPPLELELMYESSEIPNQYPLHVGYVDFDVEAPAYPQSGINMNF